MTEFERATPVLESADYEKARAFYVEKLGFSLIEEGGDPPQFGIFRKGAAQVFVDGWCGGPPEGNGQAWNAYFHVKSVDALAEAFTAAAVVIDKAPDTKAYGMREMEILDPDGNRLCFGQDADT